MSDASRWARVQEIFLEALERPVDDRDRYLAAACAHDPGLEVEARSLLAAHASDEGLGALDAPPDSPRLFGLESDHVGPWRILRPLGKGGMGMVFLATREEHDVTQTVALKLLRLDFADPKLVARFRAERNILSRLEHPGIARLIAAGATAAGQPYFAMEFVEGTSLLDYCRRRRSTVAERLRLFTEICDAVEYAHQQLVVHRDLKPCNVLVTDEGRAKLLDFGIAKLLDTDEPSPVVTRTGAWFTPEYASPEQVRGLPVTTLSDVYALGVVLYELLTGARPYDLRGLTPSAIEQRITTNPPERPSARAADPHVAKLLRGDLDTIVLKAMAREPARRYASARELADDVRRFLDREPVRARPDRWSYRASKFVQRHRVGVAAAAVAVLSLLGALGGVSWQATVAGRERDRAQQALSQSRNVSQFLADLFRAADPTRMEGDTAAARAILRQGVAAVDGLAGQPLVQARMLDALGMVFVNIGEYERARELLERGLAIRRGQLGDAHPDVAESLRHQGRVLRALSRYDEAEGAYLEATEVLRRAHEERTVAMADVLGELGFLMPYLGRIEESTRYYEEALALRRTLRGDRDSSIANGVLLVGLAVRRQGLYHQADSLIRNAVMRYRRDVGTADPRTGIALFHLADVVLEMNGSSAEAEQLYREGLSIRRAASGPLDVGAIHGLGALATLLSARGEHDEAEALLRQGLDINRKVLGPEVPAVAFSLDELAVELSRQGRWDEALAMKRDAIAMLRHALGPEHAAVTGSMTTLAEMLTAHGDYAEAQSLVVEILAMRERLYGTKHTLVGLSHSLLGEVYYRQKRYQAAEAELNQALDILRALEHEGHKDIRDTYARLALVCEAQGRREEASRYRALAGG